MSCIAPSLRTTLADKFQMDPGFVQTSQCSCKQSLVSGDTGAPNGGLEIRIWNLGTGNWDLDLGDSEENREY